MSKPRVRKVKAWIVINEFTGPLLDRIYRTKEHTDWVAGNLSWDYCEGHVAVPCTIIYAIPSTKRKKGKHER